MFWNLSRIVLLALALGACQTTPGTAWKTSARISVARLDDYETESSTRQLVDTDDIEYESVELALGGLRYSEVDGEAGEAYPTLLVEFSVGFLSLEDMLVFDPGLGGAPLSNDAEADAYEFALGFRRYLWAETLFPRLRLLPYIGLAGVHTEIEDVDGRGQFGLRVAGGLQWFIQEGTFLDVGVDYTHSLVAAESDYEPELLDHVDIELSGFALRVGIGVVF
ncbi:MAG: hypothetical protein WD226_10920 [Planctomycetota bacterium]